MQPLQGKNSISFQPPMLPHSLVCCNYITVIVYQEGLQTKSVNVAGYTPLHHRSIQHCSMLFSYNDSF